MRGSVTVSIVSQYLLTVKGQGVLYGAVAYGRGAGIEETASCGVWSNDFICAGWKEEWLRLVIWLIGVPGQAPVGMAARLQGSRAGGGDQAAGRAK